MIINLPQVTNVPTWQFFLHWLTSIYLQASSYMTKFSTLNYTTISLDSYKNNFSTLTYKTYFSSSSIDTTSNTAEYYCYSNAFQLPLLLFTNIISERRNIPNKSEILNCIFSTLNFFTSYKRNRRRKMPSSLNKTIILLCTNFIT